MSNVNLFVIICHNKQTLFRYVILWTNFKIRTTRWEIFIVYFSFQFGKNQPDKDGNMELYLFKNDLTKDFRTDEKLCMWRRDGASLLQKYMVITDESQNSDIIFKASSVYSCWEEKRKNDFFQIKVQLVGDKKEGKVKVVDIQEFDKYAVEDRPKVCVMRFSFYLVCFSNKIKLKLSVYLFPGRYNTEGCRRR